MARPGPPPTPTALRKLRGNPGHRGYNRAEPAPSSSAKAPTAPRYLNAGARKVWRRHAPELHRLGVLTDLDVSMFAAWCAAFARWLEAEERAREAGAVIKAANGYPMVNPWVNLARAAFKDAQSLGAEFGLTPASRSRIEAKPQAEADPLEVFLVRGQKAS